jgi:hypothetical protein
LSSRLIPLDRFLWTARLADRKKSEEENRRKGKLILREV